MPLLFNCQDLQTGMRLAEAFIYRGRIMIPGGKALTDTDIDALRRKYPSANLRISDPVLDGLTEFEDDGKDREVASGARQKVAASVADVQKRLGGQTSMASVDFQSVRSAAEDVMSYLSANPVSSALLDQSMDPGNPIAGHTGNVFYLSIVLGSAVRDYVMRERRRQTSCNFLSNEVAMNLLPLGLGAMFMDTGMYSLQHIYAPGYELTDADRAAIREHPERGADMLPDTLPAGTKMVVRTHHENFDGTGYPSGQPASSLHVFTRIIRICDAFVAATSNRAYRGAKSPARALWEMSRGPYRRRYDPQLARVFTGLIQPFAIGAKVRLRDGRFAVIVRYNHAAPFRPTAMIAFDKDGERLPEGNIIGPTTIGGDEFPLGEYDGEELSFVQEMNEDETAAASQVRFESLVDVAYP